MKPVLSDSTAIRDLYHDPRMHETISTPRNRVVGFRYTLDGQPFWGAAFFGSRPDQRLWAALHAWMRAFDYTIYGTSQGFAVVRPGAVSSLRAKATGVIKLVSNFFNDPEVLRQHLFLEHRLADAFTLQLDGPRNNIGPRDRTLKLVAARLTPGRTGGVTIKFVGPHHTRNVTEANVLQANVSMAVDRVFGSPVVKAWSGTVDSPPTLIITDPFADLRRSTEMVRAVLATLDEQDKALLPREEQTLLAGRACYLLV